MVWLVVDRYTGITLLLKVYKLAMLNKMVKKKKSNNENILILQTLIITMITKVVLYDNSNCNDVINDNNVIKNISIINMIVP